MSTFHKRVLLTDGYARQTLPMAKSFHDLGCTVTTLCFSKSDVGYCTKYADEHILMGCGKEEYDKQAQQVTDLLKSGQYDLVVPMTDYSAIYLSERKQQLSQYAYIAVNDPKQFSLAINKINTMRICQEQGIPAPKTLFSENPAEDIDRSGLEYPVVIKPQTACGSIGFSIIHSKDQLIRALENYDAANGALFVQEYIPQDGPQYGAEVFRDRNGRFSALLIDEKSRWFPLDGGTSTINVTIHHEQMKQMSEALLNAMDWNGYANIDFVMDSRDGQPKIIEVNGRISAVAKLDFCAGIDLGRLILENAFSHEITCYNSYPDDIRTSCCLTELLWFLKSKDRWHSKPSIFSRKNTRDVIFSWSDMRPFFGFCLQSAKNYKSAMAKRKRAE
ncbi:MAG: ATP-grasp domain-containing protein [Candidatus Faecousia sp.]|nr:ATP-grasp domain-containing protein [Candidatus Faecousia sp.]